MNTNNEINRSHRADIITVKASFLLNLPFILLPVYYCRLIVGQETGKHTKKKLKSSNNYARDLPVACLVLSIICIYTLRFFAVFNSKWAVVRYIIERVDTLYLWDPSNYLLMHGVVQFFYVVPLYLIFVEAILIGNGAVSSFILNASIISFGHICQSEFAFMKGAYHPMNKYGNLIQKEPFLATHVGAIIVSGIVAAHCFMCSNPFIGHKKAQ